MLALAIGLLGFVGLESMLIFRANPQTARRRPCRARVASRPDGKRIGVADSDPARMAPWRQDRRTRLGLQSSEGEASANPPIPPHACASARDAPHPGRGRTVASRVRPTVPATKRAVQSPGPPVPSLLRWRKLAGQGGQTTRPASRGDLWTHGDPEEHVQHAPVHSSWHMQPHPVQQPSIP